VKLEYHIPNKFYYIRNFLDYNTYKQIHYDVFRNKVLNLKNVENWFQPQLLHGFKNFIHHAYIKDDYKPLQKIKILLATNPFYKINPKQKFTAAFHSTPDGAGLNWHYDGIYDYGITYYINKRWDQSFGGEFMFKHENCNGFLPYYGNSIIIIKTPLSHKVSPVMKPTVSRKTIQIFVDK